MYIALFIIVIYFSNLHVNKYNLKRNYKNILKIDYLICNTGGAIVH